MGICRLETIEKWIVAGTRVGVAVSVAMTWADWRLNPNALFRDSEGTHWSVVMETAWSWFAPVSALITVVFAVLFVTLKRVKGLHGGDTRGIRQNSAE